MNRNIFFLLLLMGLLVSCYKDEGNYKYAKINQPEWLEGKEQPKFLRADAGQNIVLDGSKMFLWKKDSLKRSQEVHYEWTLNNKVIGNEVKVVMPTEELMKKSEITEFSEGVGTYGTFSVIENSTGVKYMAQILVRFYPKYSDDEWIVMGDNKGQATLSVLKLGDDNEMYKLIENAYPNADVPIEGKPIQMNWAKDKHIGAQGSITVITDRGGYILKGEDLSFVRKIDGELFLDGAPDDLKIVDRADHDGTDLSQPATFIATESGKVYTRMMSKNYLGGKFLSEPYYLDDKGYKIVKFGNSLYNNLIPCYDEKNRRIVVASVVTKQEGKDNEHKFMTNSIRMKALEGKTSGAPVEKYPVGSEILYLGTSGHSSQAVTYISVFNIPNFDYTLVGDILVDETSLTAREDWRLNRFVLEDKLDKNSWIVSTSNRRNPRSPMNRTMIYTKGTTVKYVQRNALAGYGFKDVTTKPMLLAELKSPVSYMTLDYEYATHLFVGCENGDILIYNIEAPNIPKLVYKTNIGHRIVSAKQLGFRRSNQDKYNY